VLVSVRPERLRLAREAGPDRIPGRLQAAMPLGPVIIYEIEAADRTPLKLASTREDAALFGSLSPGDPVMVEIAAAESCVVFPSVSAGGTP
jgi:putative spermidine/putrescine transport system ATP-binding protein